MKRLILVSTLIAMMIAGAPVHGGVDDGGDAVVVKAGRIYVLADDRTFIEDGWIIVEDGKISAIGTGPTPSWLDVVDFGDASIIPGLVSMESATFQGRDTEGIGARYVSADKFNPYADFSRSWERGITSARLAPPENRFVGGVGSVVKFGSDAEHARVLTRVADLLVNFNDEAGREESSETDIPIPSSSDVPYEPTLSRRPQSRLGRIAALEDELARARTPDVAKYDAKGLALARFLETGRPLRIDARRGRDIAQAIEAVRRTGVKAYLTGLTEAHLRVDALAEARLPVVVEHDTDLTALDDGAFNPVRPWHRSDETAARLEARGLDVVVASNTDDLLLAAAMAVSGGMSELAALRGITSHPARVLGIADRTGTLEAGKDADFVVVNGDPLSSRSHVQSVWVDGRSAWKRRTESRAVVVRAEVVHDGTGRVIHGGEVLVRDGLVVECAQSVARPKGARYVDGGPGSVLTPGFIDVHGHLGLGDDRTNVKPDLEIARAFAVAREDFADVARSGVTTVVVSPGRIGNAGAQMTAIKTGAAESGELVTKKMAAVKLRMAGGAEAARKALDGVLKKGESYHAKWKKYDEELEKWKTGKSTPAPAKEAETSEAPKKKAEEDPADAISGVWKAKLSGGPLPAEEEITLKLLLEGEDVSGSATNPLDTSEDVAVKGTFKGKTLTVTIEVETPFGDPILTATLEAADKLEGSISVGGFIEITFSAKRVQKGAPTIKVKSSRSGTTTTVDKNKPKKPKVDAALEPFRLMFDGKAGVVVEVSTPAHVKIAAKAFGAYELPVVLVPTAEAEATMHLVLDDLKDSVGVAVDRGLFRYDRDGEPVFLAGEYVDAGVPIAFRSDRGWAASRLPAVARAAVREGLSSSVALHALTGGAAKLMRLEGRVGSFAPGADGDLLLFDGDPFDVRTRLVSVFIRGKEIK